MTKSILSLPKRTIKKIIKRLQLKCCNCGWDEAPGDIHHILPRSNGGNDDHDNLAYVCPNCHRLVHNNIQIILVPLSKYIGNDWKEFYFPEKAGIKTPTIMEIRENRRFEKNQKIESLKILILQSNIDFSKYGWVQKVSKIIGITTPKVNQWMKKNMNDFYEESCFKRAVKIKEEDSNKHKE